MKKTISFAAALLLVLGMLLGISACGSTEKTTYEKAGFKADDVIITINGEDVTAQEYFYIASLVNTNLKQYYGEISDWNAELFEDGTSYADHMKKTILNNEVYFHSANSMAEEYGIELAAEDDKVLEESKNYIMENYFGGEANYEKTLKESLFVTDEIFTNINIVVPYIYERINQSISGGDYLERVGEDAVREYIDENGYMKAAHILIKTVDDDMEPLDDETVAQKKALVDELVERLQNGEDFFTLMNQYSEDPGMINEPTGYTFNANSGFVSEFVDGTAALGIGEYGVIQSVYGYHILYRQQVDLEEMAEQMCDEEFSALQSVKMDEAAVEILPAYEKLDIEKAFK